MAIKTYGVDGLMEYQARIQCGKATVVITFAGGTLTAYGNTPAEYTTADHLTQTIIERSDYYKSGRIKLLRSVADKNDEQAKEPAAVQKENASKVDVTEKNREVEVTTIEDARDYLSEKCGVKKTTLTSKKAIAESAKKHSVTFVGIEL